MAQAKRDENQVTMGMGVTDDVSLTPENLLVDPSTFELEIDILVDATLPAVTGPSQKRDGNYKPMAYAYDGTNPVPLYVDANGRLIVDITFA